MNQGQGKTRTDGRFRLSQPWDLANSNRIKPWLIEIAPLVFALGCLWSKTVWFSLSLRNLVWAVKEPVGEWIFAHPTLFTVSLSILMLLFAFTVLLPRVWRFVILLSLNLLLTSVIVVDTMHVNYYGDVASVVSILHLPMVPAVLPSIMELLKPIYGLYYIDILAGVILLRRYRRACQRIGPVSRRHRIGLWAAMIAASLFLAAPAARLAWQDPHGIFAYASLQRDVCSAIGVLPYHLADAFIHAVPRRQGGSDPDRERIARFLEERRARLTGSSGLFGVAHRRNLILISAESLQAFPIGLEIHGQPVAPRLSAFAKESLRFVNFHDQTHLGTTSDAEVASLQSLHPLAVGSVAERYAENEYYGLPAILSDHGYATLSAVGEPGSFWNMEKIHARLGFHQSFFEDNYKISERIGRWLADREFFAQTMPLLESQEEPFMAYLLSSSSHGPHRIPERYRVLKLGDLEGTQLGNYLHSIRYFDQAFGEFIDGLRSKGLLDRSAVALYGDHQAFLRNPVQLAHLLGFPEESKYHYWLAAKKIPFLVRLPNGCFSGEKTAAGGHLDIAPTLLSLLGINEDRAVLLGTDLTRGEDALVVFRDGSFTDGSHTFINRFGPVSNCTCYELAAGKTVDCQALEGRRREAFERLRISDFILQNDFIPVLCGEDTRRWKWELIVREGNVAGLVFPSDDTDRVRIDIEKAETTTPWHIQLNQPKLSVKKGHAYALSFQGRADRPRRIYFAFSKAHGDWGNLGLYKDAELTSEWKPFHAEFTAKADDQNARIHFDVGGNPTPVELKAITLHSLPDGKLIEPPRLSFANLSLAKQLRNRFLVIGHRGDPSKAPENTLSAIDRAFSIGAEMVEVDVRLSRDGVPVIMHDDKIERTTNGKGLVSQMTLEELKLLDAGSWMSPTYAGERIPTLAEALRIAKGKGPLLLDLKAEGMAGAVAQVLRDLNLPASSVVIGAWRDTQVSDFVGHFPEAQILMSTEEGFTQWESDFFARQIARGIAGFEVGADWSSAFVEAAHAHGMPVYAFTINEEPAMRELIEMGIDGIETDNPSLLLGLVKEAKKRPGR